MRQRLASAPDRMPPLEELNRHLKALKTLLLQHQDGIGQAISADFTRLA